MSLLFQALAVMLLIVLFSLFGKDGGTEVLAQNRLPKVTNDSLWNVWNDPTCADTERRDAQI